MENEDNVYELITKLCEKYIVAKPSGTRLRDVQKSRSKCYEILLNKRKSKDNILNDLENITDPVCHLVAWQYQLSFKYNSVRSAEKLRLCTEELQRLNAFSDKTLSNVVLLLLQLRRMPTRDDTIMQTSINRGNITEGLSKYLGTLFDDSLFHLPTDFSVLKSKFREQHFRLAHSRTSIGEATLSERFNLCDAASSELFEPISSEESSASPSQSIWELASREPPSKCHTWEEFGNASSSKEIPFLCESDMKSNEWLQNLPAIQIASKSRRVVEYRDFVKHIQLLLVGVESKSFKYDHRGELALAPGVCVEGLSIGATISYCKDHLFCGSCYKGLEKLCTPNPVTLSYVNNGYIFKELCESVKRYLAYYRVVVFSISHSIHLLALHERTKKLREYMKVLASVCKVGPFRESGEIPHGVDLLNYLYQKVLTQTNKNNLTVLYSILYPCCQVYFSFLRQWISEGSVNDPYGEFFISANPKYINSRGRTYWSRSYRVREDIIPDFVTGLSNDLLFCGKAMKLLKLCVPNSPLCSYGASRQAGIICCCIMSEQLASVELNNHYYYLEATTISGPRISLSHIISRLHDQDQVFLDLVSKKRAITLRRIELERKQIAEIKNRKRREEMRILKEQYVDAQIQKRNKMTKDLEQEIEILEKNIRIQSLHDKIIEEEASKLIQYYNELFEASDQRRLYYESQIVYLKHVALSPVPLRVEEVKEPTITVTSKESRDLDKTVSSDIFLSSYDDCITSKSEEFASTHSMDIEQADLDIQNANTNENSTNILDAVENLKIAKRNKAKMLALEMGYDTQEDPNIESEDLKNANNQMTDAQRNKLKVMSTEFGIVPDQFTCKKSTQMVEINRNKMLSSNKCFYREEIAVDNRKKGNDNANNNLLEDSSVDDLSTKWVNKKQDCLSLDLSKIQKPIIQKSAKSPKFELNKVSPMSIDSSTTLSDIIMTPLEKLNTNSDKYDFEYATDSSRTVTASTSTATIIKTGFNFDLEKPKNVFGVDNQVDLMDNIPMIRQVSVQDSEAISSNCLKLCLQQSISIPLITQIKLVTNELLKYFVLDLKYLQHLECLKNYFFLMDGEFGRNITEALFEKLYDSNFPIELINCHTLQALVYKALDYSSKSKDNFDYYLSFRINNLPRVFDLGDPDVFECLSLTYKTPWPLNILLPSDAIAKYDEVFKFILKLHRVSWVLKTLFRNLKSLVKETSSNKTILLLKSPQYRRLHQCRHVMTNFIQTLQNYVIAEVLQTNWEILEKNLESVTNFDQLYTTHIAYIKNILFMCLLNQKSVPVRKVLHKIFIVILKFYDYFRSRSWREVNGVYVHPNFKKLEDIFNNFEELVLYLFKIGYKVVKSGYQPHLLQLLNMLDVNDYYNQKNCYRNSLST